MTKAYIIAAKRSIVAPIGGALSELEVHELAAPIIKACIQSASIVPDQIDEVILSNALYGGGNPARLAALASGLPERIAGLTIDRQCAGGLDTILFAARMVQSGAANIVIAGGAESYSRRPIRQKTFIDKSPAQPYDRPPFTPWADRDPDMHEAAATLSQKLNISKTDQDQWAVDSHAKALRYQNATAEIVEINDTGLNDPFTRALTPALCNRAKLIAGSITNATAAVAADAAAFCVVVSETALKTLPNVTAIEITGGATVGAAPDMPGIAPVEAINTIGALGRSFHHIEIMEAYAVQAIACVQGANLDPLKVNQKGGALARGHPIGASGAILAVRLYNDLQETGGNGLAAIAAAGGIGTALQLKS